MIEYKLIISRDKRDQILKNLIENKEVFSNRLFIKDNGKDHITVKIGVPDDMTPEKIYELLVK